jgi:hypothetical protein
MGITHINVQVSILKKDMQQGHDMQHGQEHAACIRSMDMQNRHVVWRSSMDMQY